MSKGVHEKPMTDATIRPYEADDATDLWELKQGFELGIGENTGPVDKGETYEGKLTDDYRTRWLDWVDRCVSTDESSVTVAATADGLVGYAFVLPESLSFIWDAAVLNEIFVASEYRGTGVADDLMDAAIECAREQDLPLDRMVLDVDRENDRAQAFYERYGFEHWGEMVARDL
ncbi:GNAT family N-acetyltransferase [Halogeometricum borinquense]|uniref:GNAT family N-acetyltransferase n=1 Tax=Halogeometricum borinquense TaxID=60847 RepID=UPI0034309DAD